MSENIPNERTMNVRIGGMTCPSCELLLERKLKAVSGVKDADIDHKTGIARITVTSDRFSGTQNITDTIEKAGYSILDENVSILSSPSTERNKWVEIGASALIIFALYKLLQTFDIVTFAPSTSGALSLGGVFVIGLVAGTSSCLAVTGGLLLAVAAKYNERHQMQGALSKFLPLLNFNLGRLASYFVLGGMVGLLGKTVTLSTKMSGYLNIFIALVMLYLALTILQVIPKGSFPIRMPKRFLRWITGLADSGHPAASLSLGALTFFLPCGFTQSLQLAALASGSFLVGALIMFVFAVGTLPSLLGLSIISSAASGSFSRIFLRFSGTLVFVLALFNLSSGFALTGSTFLSGDTGTAQNTQLPAETGETQEVSMAVTPRGYEPNNITIRAGIPVRWKVDGTGAFGCTSILTIPTLNISQTLHKGENIIEFTPATAGKLAFMCSMGMVRGSFNVL